MMIITTVIKVTLNPVTLVIDIHLILATLRDRSGSVKIHCNILLPVFILFVQD